MRQAASASDALVEETGSPDVEVVETDARGHDDLEKALDQELLGGAGSTAKKEGMIEEKGNPAPKRPRPEIPAKLEQIALKELKKAEKAAKEAEKVAEKPTAKRKKAAESKAKASPEESGKRVKGKQSEAPGSAMGLAGALGKS